MILAKNPVFHARTKHVEMHYHFIREKVLQGEIKRTYINTKGWVADVFTKGLNFSKFEEFRRQLSLERNESLRGSVKIAMLNLRRNKHFISYFIFTIFICDKVFLVFILI